MGPTSSALFAFVTAIFIGAVKSEGKDLRLAEELKCLAVSPGDQCNLVVAYPGPLGTLSCGYKVPEGAGSILSTPPSVRLQHMSQDIQPQHVLLVMFDPDAPVSSQPEDGFIHWIAQAWLDDSGQLHVWLVNKEYYPPTPPVGDGFHRYQLFVFSFNSDSSLEVDGKGRKFELCPFVTKNNLGYPLASTQFLFQRT